jgi:hypothetical protein
LLHWNEGASLVRAPTDEGAVFISSIAYGCSLSTAVIGADPTSS